MNTELVLAWRNLWRRAKRTWITIAAMVFCNAILVFGITFQMGSYEGMIGTTLKLFSGHMQISRLGYNDDPRLRETIEDGRALAAELRAQFPELLITTRSQSFVLAATDNRSAGIQVVGVEPQFESLFSIIGAAINETNLGVSANQAMLGSVLGTHLDVKQGDELSFVGSARDGSFAADIVRVTATFETGAHEIDRAIALMSIDHFNEVFAMQQGVHQILIQVPNLDRAWDYQQRLISWLDDPDLEVLTWQQLNPGLKEAIQADLTSASVMYGILIALVIFSVLNTQLMSVLERTHEYGIMKAIGLSNLRLGKLIFIETALMALIGLILGVLLGGAMASYVATVGLMIPGMEEANYSFQIPDRLYPLITINTLFVGPVIVFIGSLIAAIYPARKLYKLQPIEAMRAQ